MRNTTDRLRLTRRRNPAQTDGTGSTSHGHGRKGDVNRCGIMRNDCSNPVKITQTNPKIAQVIITQFGGRNVIPITSRKAFIFKAHEM